MKGALFFGGPATVVVSQVRERVLKLRWFIMLSMSLPVKTVDMERWSFKRTEFIEGNSGLPREVVYNVKSVGAKKRSLLRGGVSREGSLHRGITVCACVWVGR